MENEFDIPLLLGQITSSRIAAFGWLDARAEDMRNWWLPLVAPFTVGSLSTCT
jgi:hypothetical protein